MIFHPRLNERGEREPIHSPDVSSASSAWLSADALATVVPADTASLPAMLSGLAFASWAGCQTVSAWESECAGAQFGEPPFTCGVGQTKASAGAIVLEPDGRVWVVSPTNRFGGYRHTFPKGTQERGMSLRATALKEVFEESGLRVSLTGFLVDAERTTSRCRFYLAKRTGGSPADMGWESQAVHLVPQEQLHHLVTHAKDAFVLHALERYLGR